LQKEPVRGRGCLSVDGTNTRSQHESVTNNSNIYGGNNNNPSATGCNRSNRSIQEEMSSISGLHHAAQHPFSTMGLTLLGKHSEIKSFHQHSPETNGMKDLLSPSLSSGRADGDNVGPMSSMVKEEPEFYETICCWVGCDRGDLQSQDALVKVGINKHQLNCFNKFNSSFVYKFTLITDIKIGTFLISILMDIN